MSAVTLEIAHPGRELARLETKWPQGDGAQAFHFETEASPIEFRLIKQRAQFDALEAGWNALYERAGRSHHLFLSFNWLWHWCNHYLDEAAGAELAILTAWKRERLVMVWPMVRERAHGLTELSWMGDPMSQYGDALAEEGPEGDRVLRAAWNFIRLHCGADIVRLRKVRADARIAPLLQELGALVTGRLEAPYLDLASAASFAEYEKRYSSGSRRNRKRLFRRLDEQGKITLEEIEGGARAIWLVKTAIELKRRWLNSRGLVSKAYADDRIVGFFGDAAAGGEKPAGCRIALISSAGRPAAIEIAVRGKDRIGLHIIVFDVEFEKSGAGVLLLEQSIRNAANAGVACYDLLAPGDSYKLDWADGTVGVNDYAMALSAKGKLYARVYLGFLRERLKACHAALPAPIRRALAERISRLAKAA